MNNELLEALTVLEKEKDISKETMLEAIENSLLTACKNHFGKSDNIKVSSNAFSENVSDVMLVVLRFAAVNENSLSFELFETLIVVNVEFKSLRYTFFKFVYDERFNSVVEPLNDVIPVEIKLSVSRALQAVILKLVSEEQPLT